MRNLFILGGVAAGGLFLSSCETYPYQSAFSACESEANACYRLCESIPDERGYVSCQSHCDRDIDRCFDTAYSSYYTSYNYYGGYGYSSPWYGRYGSWYPDTGYFLSFNYYDRYGYRKKRHHPHRDHYGRDHDDRGGKWDRDRRRSDGGDRHRRYRDDDRPRRNTPPSGGGYRQPTPPPADSGAGADRPGRNFNREKPDRTRRVYRRPAPAYSPAPAEQGSDAGSPPPRVYTPPARTPRRAAPPPARQPAPPPADSQPSAEPAPPPERPAGAERVRRNPNARRNVESVDSIKD